MCITREVHRGHVLEPVNNYPTNVKMRGKGRKKSHIVLEKHAWCVCSRSSRGGGSGGDDGSWCSEGKPEIIFICSANVRDAHEGGTDHGAKCQTRLITFYSQLDPVEIRLKPRPADDTGHGTTTRAHTAITWQMIIIRGQNTSESKWHVLADRVEIRLTYT